MQCYLADFLYRETKPCSLTWRHFPGRLTNSTLALRLGLGKAPRVIVFYNFSLSPARVCLRSWVCIWDLRAIMLAATSLPRWNLELDRHGLPCDPQVCRGACLTRKRSFFCPKAWTSQALTGATGGSLEHFADTFPTGVLRVANGPQ